MAGVHENSEAYAPEQIRLVLGVDERECPNEGGECFLKITRFFEDIRPIDQQVLSLTTAVGLEGTIDELERFGQLALCALERGLHTEHPRLIEKPIGISGLAGLPENIGPLEFVLGLGTKPPLDPEGIAAVEGGVALGAGMEGCFPGC